MANAWFFAPVPIVGVTASGTSAGEATNVANDYAGLMWRSAGAGGASAGLLLEDGSALLLEDGSALLLEGDVGEEVALTLDLGEDRPIDTLLLFGVSAPEEARLTVDAATEAQGSGFGAGAFHASPQQMLFAGANRLANGRGVALWQAPEDGRPAVRYLRLRIELTDGASVEIARAAAGQRVRLARNFSFGSAFGARDFGTVDFSVRGVLLRRRGAKLRVANMIFSSIHRDEAEAAVLPLLETAGNTEPIVLVTDPSPNAMIERRCYFGPIVGDLLPNWRTAAGWEWRSSLTSLF